MTTYPTYQSPIRTFQDLGLSTDNIDAQQLKFERKRLLLEIQISDSQTTTIGDRELSKNDVIELFDSLDRISHLDYHTAIFNHPVLLNLLENHTVVGTIKKEHKIHFETVDEWDKFIAFVSPYLANAIDKLLSKVIRKTDFDDLEKIVIFLKLLTTNDSYFAFRKFNNFCETLEDRLDVLAYKNKKFPGEHVKYLHQASFYNTVNELTRPYPNLPDTVASAVISFTVDCERKAGRGKHLVEISDQARRLHSSAKTRSLLIGNREAFWESREQFLKFNPNMIWRLIVGIFIFGSLIMRANRGCESRNRDYSAPDHYELLEQIDALEREGVKDYSVTTVTKGTSDIDESSFLDLHEKVIRSIELSEYAENLLISQGEPKIFSRFTTDVVGTEYSLSNETDSELLMVIWADSNLNSYYVDAGNSITFPAGNNACIFFYSGKRWKDNRTIEHWHRSPKTNAISQIRFNGYFSYWTEDNFMFLKKYFTLTDGDSDDFKVTNDDGPFEFYQGDRHVNYSY